MRVNIINAEKEKICEANRKISIPDKERPAVGNLELIKLMAM
jgi:hypothetical protein